MKEFIDDKRKIWWKRIKIFLIVCLASVGVLMIVSVSRNVNHSMKDNQLRTLDTVAGRITENMRSYFYQQWQDLEFIERNMVNRSYETEDDILQFLDFEKGAIGFRNSNNKPASD